MAILSMPEVDGVTEEGDGDFRKRIEVTSDPTCSLPAVAQLPQHVHLEARLAECEGVNGRTGKTIPGN